MQKVLTVDDLSGLSRLHALVISGSIPMSVKSHSRNHLLKDMSGATVFESSDMEWSHNSVVIVFNLCTDQYEVETRVHSQCGEHFPSDEAEEPFVSKEEIEERKRSLRGPDVSVTGAIFGLTEETPTHTTVI